MRARVTWIPKENVYFSRARRAGSRAKLQLSLQFIVGRYIFPSRSVCLPSRDRAATTCAWCKIPIARPVLRYFVPGEGRRSHAIFVSRVHELFGGQRRTTRTLSFLYPTVGRLELGPRHYVQLRYLRCHALLQRTTQGESRIRDEPFDPNSDSSNPRVLMYTNDGGLFQSTLTNV